MTKRIEKIIVHPGIAHADELWAIAILKAAGYTIDSIERRVPTIDDLTSTDIWVIDVGNQLDDDKNNYDHHQDRNLPASCMIIAERFLPVYKEIPELKEIIELISENDTTGILNRDKEKSVLRWAEFALTRLFQQNPQQATDIVAEFIIDKIAFYEKKKRFRALLDKHAHTLIVPNKINILDVRHFKIAQEDISAFNAAKAEIIEKEQIDVVWGISPHTNTEVFKPVLAKKGE